MLDAPQWVSVNNGMIVENRPIENARPQCSKTGKVASGIRTVDSGSARIVVGEILAIVRGSNRDRRPSFLSEPGAARTLSNVAN